MGVLHHQSRDPDQQKMLDRITLVLLFISLPLCSALWEAKVSFSDKTSFQFHQIAVEHIQRFNDDCDAKAVPAEDRFEMFVRDYENLVRRFRMSAQQIVGPIDEGNAIDVFLSEMWWVYGYVMVPNSDIKTALTPIVPYTKRWVDPYGGTGYFAMQIQRTLGVDIESWDKKPRHMQWLPMKTANATSADYSEFDTFVLGYPCCQDDCWAGVAPFTSLPTAKYLVFLGEPRGHYCVDDSMWDSLCRNWELRLAHRLEAGLPGSYHHLFVFSRKGRNDLGCDVPCGEGKVCPCPVRDCFETAVL
eukprot:c7762_g1_i1.p1 GENE.c7762_g1_i1~~c7762_g1_i1.p1  ORF type:complete len:302 (-),score=52.79 c7762_g1_i1:36-941(-)